MSIRRLTPADAEAYRALSLRGFALAPDAFTSTVAEREAQPLSVWQQRLSPDPGAPDEVHGAFVDGQLVGCAGLLTETRTKTRHKATLVGMFVAPEAAGRGFGQALVLAVLAAARARPGLRVVTLTVTEGNVRAESLYARCGFVRFGVEPLAVRDPGTGAFFAKVHMQCELHPNAS